jgi:hypothetical protein
MPKNRMNMPTNSGFTAKQERVATLLAGGMTARAAAAEAGCAERTVGGWLAVLPGYAAYVVRLRDAAVGRAVALLGAAATKAATTLIRLLDSADEPVKLRAATSLLDMMIKTREHSELAGRLAAMEARLAESGDGRAERCG